MKFSIDINNSVYVQLTNKGVDVVYEFYKNNARKIYEHVCLLDYMSGWWQFSFYELMQIFWSQVRNADAENSLPFVGGNIIFAPMCVNLSVNLNDDVFAVLTSEGEKVIAGYYGDDLRSLHWDNKRMASNSHLRRLWKDDMKLMSFFLGDFLQLFGESIQNNSQQLFLDDLIMFVEPKPNV